jgi:hypothetical protein
MAAEGKWMSLDDFFRSSLKPLNVQEESIGNYKGVPPTGEQTAKSKVGLQDNAVPVKVVRDDALSHGLPQTYMNTCVSNTIVCEAASGIADEFVGFTADAFRERYKKDVASVQRKLSELLDAAVKSVLVKGFCILLRQEDDPSSLGKPVKYTKENTHSMATSDQEDSDDEDEVEEEAPVRQPTRCTVNGHPNAVLIDNNTTPFCAMFDNHDPTYTIDNELASHIYVSRFSKCYAIDVDGIMQTHGIADAHKRICVVGFEGVHSNPRCVPVFSSILLIHVLTQSTRLRMGLNTVPIICAKLQTHEQLSLLLGPNKEIVDTLYDMTQAGVQQLDSTLSDMSQNMLNERLSSYGNASAAPFRVITVPPGWEASPIAQQTLDPLTTTVIDKATAVIAAHLGVSGGGGPMRFREQSFYTIGRLAQQFSIRTSILKKLMPAIPPLFGVSIASEEYEQMNMENRITKLTSMVVRAAVGDKIVDASKGVDIDQVAADAQHTDSVAKRPHTHDDRDAESDSESDTRAARRRH